MLTRNTDLILAALERGELPADSTPVPQGIFMVEPENFRLSPDSGRDNHYMDFSEASNPDRALDQYFGLVRLIRQAGIEVKSFPGDKNTPDGIFPNNTFGTAPGRFVVGHMHHPSRQLETGRKDIREYFHGMGYLTIDLSIEDCVAELTGTLIIDRARRLGFCGMTDRVNQAGALAMLKAFNLRHILQFDLSEGEYHTNVVMSVLAGRACVLHAASVASDSLGPFLSRLYDGRVLYLDEAEKNAFAGNCIALSHQDVFMSRAAVDALSTEKRELLRSWEFKIHSAELDEIEKAGGSLRCMVAEIF